MLLNPGNQAIYVNLYSSSTDVEMHIYTMLDCERIQKFYMQFSAQNKISGLGLLFVWNMTHWILTWKVHFFKLSFPFIYIHICVCVCVCVCVCMYLCMYIYASDLPAILHRVSGLTFWIAVFYQRWLTVTGHSQTYTAFQFQSLILWKYVCDCTAYILQCKIWTLHR